MLTPTNETKKRLVLLKRAVPTRGMERYPSLLKDISELPIELQSPAVTNLAANETIQNTPCSLWNELSFQMEQGGQTAHQKIQLTASAARAWLICWNKHGGQWQELPSKPDKNPEKNLWKDNDNE